MPPALLFFFKIALAIGVFCGSMHILGLFVLALKNDGGILIGIALNV